MRRETDRPEPRFDLVRRGVSLCAYSVGCAALHGLLQQHYLSTCRASWLSLFSVDPGPYCAFVRKGLLALQWAPVLACGLWVPAPARQALTGLAGLAD